MSLDNAQVEAALAEFKDPETGRSVVKTNQVKEINVDGQSVAVTLALSTHSAPVWDETKAACEERLKSSLAAANVTVNVVEHDRPASPIGQIGLTAKTVIAIGSGKGGVGKSTVATSVALALKRFGSKVGLMDADVYGPSVPHLLGIGDAGRPAVSPENKIQPIETSNGMPVMSMGFLVPPEEAVVWRGPMLHGAITQFLRDTQWGNLDYLIIDMPPGTGDIALTLSQSLPLTGAVVVCTPQDVALLDAVKAIVMFRKVNIKVLGMVENMSGFVCPDCNKRYDIFGSGGATERAKDLDVPVLGEVPITIAIREHGDAGKTDDLFDQAAGDTFAAIAQRITRQLADAAALDPPMPQLPILG